MNARTTIRKIVFITVWIAIGGGLFTLLLAAIENKNRERCSDYTITLKGAKQHFFIDENDVRTLLQQATSGAIKGELITSFRLQELEEMLEHNTWIDAAELYFDNRNVLHVTVTEKEPVARIFTTTGTSFYIDSAGYRIPLSDKRTAQVPVFTGFPARKKWNTRDSVLLNQVRQTANCIQADPFWMAQVAQVNITEDQQFEMVPVVGDHLVKMGAGKNMDQKFNRLMLFYKEVLSKTGFNRYKLIDVQYAGQVVVSKYAGDPKVDSVQLRKNVDRLLRLSREAQAETAVKNLPPAIPAETSAERELESPAQLEKVEARREPEPKQETDERKPKAIMPKKTTTTNQPIRNNNN